MFDYIKLMYNYFENSNLIIPANNDTGSIWLSNYYTALDPQFLIENNISVIINCSPDIPYIYDILDIRRIYKLNTLETTRIPIFDSLLQNDLILMERYFPIVIPFTLQKLIHDKKNVLIHCRAGRQRSAAFLAAVLYTIIKDNLIKYKIFDETYSKDKDKDKLMLDIIDFIIKKRPQAFSYGFRINFKQSLENYFNIKIKR